MSSIGLVERCQNEEHVFDFVTEKFDMKYIVHSNKESLMSFWTIEMEATFDGPTKLTIRGRASLAVFIVFLCLLCALY